MTIGELDLVAGLSSGVYVHDRAHELLAQGAWKSCGPNIGDKGQNLTISFLSMNRVGLSEKLLQSISNFLPDFAGHILVVDNGSLPEELARLHSLCSQLPFQVRILELGQNFGVAGGRNRCMPYVETEWVMCLDNDIYFTANPLSCIQRDLAVLGCHFMSIPLLEVDGKGLFARGGHLYVSIENEHLHIGAGSACRQTESAAPADSPFLCTFLFGGACVLNKETFIRAGGYDEGMFVGFEDIDFSIRLFQQGYKVGATSICALVHDHPEPDNSSDKEYEKKRFSRDALFKSAMYLEAKHGFKVWSNAVDHWLASRHEDLGLEPNFFAHDSAVIQPPTAQKIKIGLVIDTDHWAFGNISRQLIRYLSDRFEFQVVPMDIIDNIDRVLIMLESCQIIHFFWREHLTLIGTSYYRSYAESLGFTYGEFHARFIENKIFSTSIYDHLLLDESELAQRAGLFSSFIKGYTVGSQKLNTIYSNLSGYPPPAMVVEDGVDLDRFKPMNLERFANIAERDLIIGWVGNSQWASEIEDFKGVNTILKPAIEQLQNQGLRITPYFADRQQCFIPHEEMPAYYAKIDVLVCTSKIEGTPNPVLEAMACGVPIISTDVGIVPQVFGRQQRSYILKERSIEALKNMICDLRLNHNVLQDLSTENLLSIKSWDWSIKTSNFACYFEHLLPNGASSGDTSFE